MRPKQTEHHHVENLIRRTELGADDAAPAFTKTKGLVASRLEQQALEMVRRYQDLSAHKLELQEALKLEMMDSTVANLMQSREVVAAGLSNPTFDEKLRWLELLQVRVIVTDGKALISFLPHRSSPLPA